MRLKKVNTRILEARSDGWFWDSHITKGLAKCILSLKNGEEIELKAKNATFWVEREEEEKFFINLEEYNEQFDTSYSNFTLWKKDLEKIANSLEKKPIKETFHSVVNAPLYPKYRSSIRAFKKALRRAKRRSCFLGGFTEIQSVTSASAKRFLSQRGFKISPEGELFHPRSKRNTAEKVNQYKSDKLLEEFGLL